MSKATLVPSVFVVVAEVGAAYYLDHDAIAYAPLDTHGVPVWKDASFVDLHLIGLDLAGLGRYFEVWLRDAHRKIDLFLEGEEQET